MSSRLNRLVGLLTLTLMIASPVICEAGSGSRSTPSRGSGNRGYSAGSGNRNAGPSLANTVLHYEGKLKKGDVDGNEKATMEGFLRLSDGKIFAAKDPNASNRAAFSFGPSVTYVAFGDSTSQEIGEYRVSRSGRMTLLFGVEDGKRSRGRYAAEKEGSGKKAFAGEKEGSGKKALAGEKEGSGKKAFAADKEGSGKKASAANVADHQPLRGVMVLAYKKRRNGDYYAGSFREQDEKGKTIRTWQIRLEPAKDARRSA